MASDFQSLGDSYVIKPNLTSRYGFTIVELLVVIVVIGILAVITIVSYTGIQQRAISASLTSDLDSASRQLKLFQVDNSNYPTTINCAIPDSSTNKCLKASAGTTYTYVTSNNNAPQIFCITATKNSQNYNTTQDNITSPGVCPILHLDARNVSSYPKSGINWVDLSGNANNGTLNGGVTYSATNGGVMSFNGVDGYVNAGNGASLNALDAFTIGVWFNSTTNTEVYTALIDKSTGDWTGGSAKTGFWLAYYGLGDTTPGNNLVFDLGDGNVSNDSISFGDLRNTGWTYIVITVDSGSNSSPKIFGYKNGILFTQANRNRVGSINVASMLYLGQWGSYTRNFSGQIGDVSIYNKALSADEITQNFNTTKARYGL